MRQHDPQERMRHAQDRRQTRRRGGKFVPLLIVLLFGLFIATQEIPRVQEWVEGVISPDTAKVRRSCLQEALAASRQPDFARVIDTGEIEPTTNGYLVRDVIIGEMGNNGNEAQYEYTCYLDATGRIVNSHREDR